MTERIYDEIIKLVSADRVLRNEPMSGHTTFRVGGPVDIFVSIKDEKEAAAVVRLLSMNKVPYLVIGNGSNLLVCDEGFRGVVVEVGRNFSDVSISEDRIMASAGALMVKVANDAYKAGLSGLEFASGIPGTIGGGVCMNAGAYGGELKDVVSKVTLLDVSTGEIVIKNNEEMDFSYRHSIIKDNPYIVLSVEITLKKGIQEEIKARMDELKDQRTAKQPLEYPSAGSTFKRPEGYFAGKLIQDAGLKGYTVGGAQVSEKHSGFVINRGGATASDIMTLIDDVARIVKEKFDVQLEPEVIIVK